MRRAEPVAGLGGILLLVSLFLPWYGADLGALEGATETSGGIAGVGSAVAVLVSPEATAWQTFSVFDILLALCALPAIAVPIVSLLASGPAKPIGTQVLASFFSGIALLLVAYRLVNPPGPNEFIALEYGAWLALAGAIIALVGSWLSMRDESTPGAAPPDVPLRPAPPVSAS